MARGIEKWTPVVVEWFDAATIAEEMHSDKLDTVSTVRRSIGFLLRRNKLEVVICMEDDRAKNDPESDCQTVTGIPSKMVKSITVMEAHKKESAP